MQVTPTCAKHYTLAPTINMIELTYVFGRPQYQWWIHNPTLTQTYIRAYVVSMSDGGDTNLGQGLRGGFLTYFIQCILLLFDTLLFSKSVNCIYANIIVCEINSFSDAQLIEFCLHLLK